MAIVYHISSIKSSTAKAVKYITKEEKVNMSNAINYITQETKVENGELELVKGYNCSSDKEIFMLESETLRKMYNKNNNILAHHYVQSFAKNDNIDPQQALDIGYQLAEESFPNYQVLIATHIDKEHIHNHFIINAVGLDGKKYVDTAKQHYKVREVSNRLCKENGLSYFKDNAAKGEKRKSYSELDNISKGTSWKEMTRNDIDKMIIKSKDFDDFIIKMKELGYSIKVGENVKYLSFKHKDQERFSRGKTLGMNYTEEKIKIRIDNKILEQYKVKPFIVKGKEVKNNNMRKYYYKKANFRNNLRLLYVLLKSTFNKVDLLDPKEIKPKGNLEKKTFDYEKYKKVVEKRKEVVENSKVMKSLESALKTINDERISSIEEVKEKINIVNNKLDKINKFIESADKNNSKMEIVINHINNLESKNKGIKNISKNVLENMGLKNKNDMDLFKNKYEKINSNKNRYLIEKRELEEIKKKLDNVKNVLKNNKNRKEYEKDIKKEIDKKEIKNKDNNRTKKIEKKKDDKMI